MNKLTMLKKIIQLFSLTCLISSPLAVITTPSAHSGEVGVSCADCPSYRASFSIEDEIDSAPNVSAPYEVRWGNKGKWKQFSVYPGRGKVHSYPLGENPKGKVPQPYIRFNFNDPNNRVYTVHKVNFYAVGYTGYGGRENTTKPKPYAFRFIYFNGVSGPGRFVFQEK
jgi:hypothetical protein